MPGGEANIPIIPDPVRIAMPPRRKFMPEIRASAVHQAAAACPGAIHEPGETAGPQGPI